MTRIFESRHYGCNLNVRSRRPLDRPLDESVNGKRMFDVLNDVLHPDGTNKTV